VFGSRHFTNQTKLTEAVDEQFRLELLTTLQPRTNKPINLYFKLVVFATAREGRSVIGSASKRRFALEIDKNRM